MGRHQILCLLRVADDYVTASTASLFLGNLIVKIFQVGLHSSPEVRFLLLRFPDRKLGQYIHWACQHNISPLCTLTRCGGLRANRPTNQIQKSPLSKTDRGRNKRGTTSSSAFPHGKCPHGVQQRLSLFRATPSFPTECFRKATPGGISADFPTALHQPAALWRKRDRLLIPIFVFTEIS
jgi:hypothetical protein